MMRTTLDSKTPGLQNTLSVENDIAIKHETQPVSLDSFEHGSAEQLFSYQKLLGAAIDQGVTKKVFELMLSERSGAKPEIVLERQDLSSSGVWWNDLAEQIEALSKMPSHENVETIDESVRGALRALAAQAPHRTIEM